MSNIIIKRIIDDVENPVRTMSQLDDDRLVQWDKDVTIVAENFEYSSISGVQLSHQGENQTYVLPEDMYSLSASEQKLTVNLPDDILTDSRPINVYLVVDGKTMFYFRMPVVKKAKPVDYVASDDLPTLKHIIDAEIASTIASSTQLGVVKIGANLSIDSNGVLSSNGSKDIYAYNTRLNKNYLDTGGLLESTENGVTYKPVYDKNNELEYILIDGTATETDSSYTIGYFSAQPNTSYIMNGNDSDNHCLLYCGIYKDEGESVLISNTTSTEKVFGVTIEVAQGETCSNEKIYPMIRLSDVEDDSYEPGSYGTKFPVTGETDVIYIETNTNHTYRWDDNEEEYILISSVSDGDGIRTFDTKEEYEQAKASGEVEDGEVVGYPDEESESIIDDSSISENSTWSSSKINSIIGNISSILDSINGEVI